MNLLFAIAALLVVAAQAEWQKAPPLPPLLPGTSSIAGRVVDAADKPLEGAEVVIEVKPVPLPPGSRPVRRVAKTLTDRDGLFEFREIAAGTYLVFATHRHHLPATCVGMTTCGEVEVAAGESRRDFHVQMRPAGIVTGRLIDFEGRPVAGAGVMAWFEGGHQPTGRPGISDADGRFEINGMRPGSSVIAAEVRGQSGVTRVYYPGVVNLDEAQQFTIEPGNPLEIEIRIPEITEAAITANVSGPDGSRLDTLTLLRPQTRMRLPLSTHDSVVTAINLRQGRYVIEALATADQERLAAFAVVELQSIDVEVPLHLQPAGKVSGKIVLERGGLPPVQGVRVAAVWTSDGVDVKPSPDETSVGPDGAFGFPGLFGHRDFRVIGLPDTWQVTAIRAGRSDITATGLDIESGSTTELTIVVARR